MRKDASNGLATFLRVYRREEELVHVPATVGLVSAFVLKAADNPVAAGFGFPEGVEVAVQVFGKGVAEDDLDTGGGGTAATVNDLRSQCVAETEVDAVQSRVDFGVHKGRF